jgi:hypothetical protein
MRDIRKMGRAIMIHFSGLLTSIYGERKDEVTEIAVYKVYKPTKKEKKRNQVLVAS